MEAAFRVKRRRHRPSMADSVITLEVPPPPSTKQSTQKKRKTREQPNLSDCHSCSRRTNSTNPKERLRPLSSEWRIVLLCKQCYKLVESARLCSYCFSDSGAKESSPVAGDIDSFHRCPRCERRIHTDCMSKYSAFPPWSFSAGAGGGVDPRRFSLCVDCWIPKLLDKRSRVDRSRSKRKRGLKVSAESCSFGNSRVSDSREKRKLLEVAANEADCLARKKIATAVEATGKALLKAAAAGRAVELAAEALNLVAKRREKCGETGAKDFSVIDDDDDDDDAQLAFQLHRAMNNSPRIVRNLCLPNNRFGKCAKESSQDGASCLRSRLGGSGSNVPIHMDALESEAVVQTSSSGKSMNPDGDENNNTDAESGSSVELLRRYSGENEQICLEKRDVSLETVHKDRYLRKYSRRASRIMNCGFRTMSFDLSCRAAAGTAHLTSSDQSGAVADAS
ncbi:hypothetical protein Dimus_011989 [Dionaea muscipula]